MKIFIINFGPIYPSCHRTPPKRSSGMFKHTLSGLNGSTPGVLAKDHAQWRCIQYRLWIIYAYSKVLPL